MEGKTLTHWGVKGMKWGVRRFQNEDGTLTPAGKKRRKSVEEHDDYKRAHDKTDVRTMSDNELRARINRIQMEKQYSQLTKKETSAGRKFVGDVMREAAKDTAKSYVSKWMKKGIEKGIAKAVERSKNPLGLGEMNL